MIFPPEFLLTQSLILKIKFKDEGLKIELRNYMEGLPVCQRKIYQQEIRAGD